MTNLLRVLGRYSGVVLCGLIAVGQAVSVVGGRGYLPGGETRTGLGITVDEIHRARNDRSDVEYPLLELGLFRDECETIIAGAGLPIPPKSACYFCPFSSLDRWRTMKQRDPEAFAKAVALERKLQGRRVGKSPVFLTRYGRNLDEVVDEQLLLDLDDGCESGYCMT